MARGISIKDVTNKIKIVKDKDVLPVSTGDNNTLYFIKES